MAMEERRGEMRAEEEEGQKEEEVEGARGARVRKARRAVYGEKRTRKIKTRKSKRIHKYNRIQLATWCKLKSSSRITNLVKYYEWCSLLIGKRSLFAKAIT